MSLLLRQGGLIVSCQARADNPLHGAAHMAAMAQAAEQGGAAAIRANGAADIAALGAAVDLPVIGIEKDLASGDPVYITPTHAAARRVLEAGAQIVALDCTDRPRRGDPWEDVLAEIHAAGAESFADIATLDEALRAEQAGVTYIATTLAGYTDPAAPRPEGPDLDLVSRLAARLGAPLIAEGRIATPDQALAALEAGAHAVVVGTMITNPREITRHFAGALGAFAGQAERV